MPFNLETNKWDNATDKANKERTWIEKGCSKMSNEPLLKEAGKGLWKSKFQGRKCK